MVDDDLEHEAIELCFGQGIGSLELDGILGGEDVERLGELVRGALDGDAVLLHRLQKGRLCLRRRAVDLVGQDDVREDGSPLEHELPASGGRVFLDDVRAGDVGGHQVRRELDPGEVQIEDAGHGMDEQGLRQSRHTHEEAVAPHEQAEQDLLDDLLLPDDELPQLRDDLFPAGLHAICQVDVIRSVEGLTRPLLCRLR